MSKISAVALACAAIVTALPDAAFSQEAASQIQTPAADLTAGGDVTAEDVTVLPPVTVTSAAPPPVTRATRKPGTPSAAPASAQASANGEAGATSGKSAGPGIFTLGELNQIGGATISNQTMWQFNKDTLSDALSIVPGVTVQNTGGSRNERDIFVRGFDRYRVPLYVDGVRIYLPADNRLDYNRFLTPDLSEVQVQEGYVSVLDGPGGMGGAINMVSRKPTKAVEAEGRVGAVWDGDLDRMNLWSGYAFGGTRQDHYYAQASATILDQRSWNLSDNFTPVLIENEDGGARDHSSARDWRINTKFGITPNASDEYSLNYTAQHGAKEAPLHVEGQQVQGPRYWDWPYWNLSSLSWISKTQLGTASYVKTRAYYNTFDNLLSSYDDVTYTGQATGKSFNSYYDDYAYGGSTEFGTDLIPMNTLKLALHYRRDDHQEQSYNAPDGAKFVEPWQENKEDTWSLAAENTFHATSRLDIVGGIAWNQLEVVQAQDYGTPEGASSDRLYNYPTSTTHAFDYQGAAVYSYSATGKAHVSVSDRTRFPTMFERFSTRFGLVEPNPDLGPERAVNYELGFSDVWNGNVHVAGAVFYSDLSDSIQPVYVASKGSNAIQNQNIDGEIAGVEMSFDWNISRTLTLGGNYTYLHRDYDYLEPGIEPEGTPQHEGFVYLAWNATDKLTLTPSLELASNRYSMITSGDSSLLAGSTTPNYAKLGSYQLLNFQADYAFATGYTLALGASNLLDQDYELSDGFPEPGRQIYAKLRGTF